MTAGLIDNWLNGLLPWPKIIRIMGICFARISRKKSEVTSWVPGHHDLDSLKERFVLMIFQLHDLSLRCRALVEEMLIEGKGFRLLLSRLKKLF